MSTRLANGMAAWALAAALSLVAACAEAEREPSGAQLTDFAAGVDADFSVESFAIDAPSLKIASPANGLQVQPGAPATPVELAFTVAFHDLAADKGKIRCHLNGNDVLTTIKTNDPTTNTIADLGAVGVKQITCVLLDSNGNKLANPEAFAKVWIYVTKACSFSEDCDDKSICSQETCIGSKCQFAAVNGCCMNSLECNVGETCTSPNTVDAKCSACTNNADCDDGSACTTDKCDLSGEKGKCLNTKIDPESCCSLQDAECNDGLPCTVDVCDKDTKTCKHTKPEGTCCADSDCKSADVCLVAVCVDFECRYGPDKFKDDCCSPTFNPKCNDNYICTIDSCVTDMGGWKQCKHVKDPDKPKCCDAIMGNTNECNDGNACTYDVCTPDNTCFNKMIGNCCNGTTIKCEDGNTCTEDKCVIAAGQEFGICEYPKTDPLCCHFNLDCADGKFCTSDVCNKPVGATEGTCKFTVGNPSCCDTDDQCDDGKYCTVGQCVNHSCVFGPDKFKLDCCEANGDCNDGNACSIDTCDTASHTCKAVPNGDPLCCNFNEDCDDKDCTTLKFCDATKKCVFKADPAKCATALDCDDNNACTVDSCDKSGECGVCIHTPDANCCNVNTDCDDGKLCTTDSCVANKCENKAKAGCCVDDKDAVTACDDNASCTIEYCVNYTCRHTAPKGGCCNNNLDCNDGSSCTIDKCQNIVSTTGKGTCASIQDPAKPDCKCSVDQVLSDCDDGNACTTPSCIGGKCVQNAKVGCCVDKFDCDDSQPCTTDLCVTSLNYCVHAEYGGSSALCCSKETEGSDCAYLNTECAVGTCETQPDKSRKCVATPVDICTVQVSYCQDFSGATTLKAMGWNPGDIKSTAATNWKVSTAAGLGPDQFAELTWTPTYTDFDTCLQSPILQAAGSKKITMQYDQIIDLNKFGNTNVRLLGSLDGANVDWTKATLIDVVTPQSDVAAGTLDVTLPPELTGSNGLRLAFCVAGKTTFDLTRYGVDNICVAKGSKPTLTQCPPAQVVKLFGNKAVPLKATDPDASAILTYSVVKGPSFVSVSSAYYYWLDGSWNSGLTIAPQSYNDVGTHDVTIKVSDGFLYTLCTFQVTVTYVGGHLVWRPTEVPSAAGESLTAAIKANYNGIVQHVTDLGLYTDLKGFSSIFISLGVFPDNHVLKESEVGALKLYLQGGGNIYLESGDTWAFDSKTSLHPFFAVKAQGDYGQFGVTGPLVGKEIYRDISASPVKIFDYKYAAGDAAWDNLNDQMLADTSVKDTRNVLLNDGANELFWVQVARQDPAVGYKTVASSVLFGGVQKGVTDQPATMVGRILNFFNNGFVDCSTDAHCDDSNACTTDKCSSQKCNYTNTCTCQGSGTLVCSAGQSFDASTAKATDVVDSYSCDVGKVYDAPEVAWEFSSATSKPITLDVSSLTGSGAKVFVLRASDTGCDPAQCIASGTVKLNFAAAKGAKYFIVLDAQGNTAPKANVTTSCGNGEICDDSIDNNGNTLVDCKDLGSCCGDTACAELCDGLDNDCDGKTDENCDDDGDDFCDALMTVVGTPATCPYGGGDCNDDNASVNPGLLEICGNGKDDNCDGQQDEAGASGCTNHFIDLDKDGFGTGVPKCLCAPSGGFNATKGGDCNDADPKVNPADQPEVCGNGLDDDCTGSQNDLNALGCTDFYTDTDSDGWGTAPKKCLCFSEGATTAGKVGDCDDNDKTKNPGLTELCNGKDDDCDFDVDEGCDDDKDGYCDLNMSYAQVDGTKNVCGTANQGQVLTLACASGSTITSVSFASYGKPTGSCGAYSTGACHAGSTLQKVKDLCLGKVGCAIPADNGTFSDPCGGIVKHLTVEVVCTSSQSSPPPICPKGPGDSDDTNPDINPKGKEICDGLDNNSNGSVDEGCDDDKDGYCDLDMIVVGAPKSCPKGGGDCADTKSGVNPGAAEDCDTPDDDNCDGETNTLNAANCTTLFYDGDSDKYGISQFQCLCSPSGKYTAPKTGDCDDSDPTLNPGNAEICDNKDNNCNAPVNSSTPPSPIAITASSYPDSVFVASGFSNAKDALQSFTPVASGSIGSAEVWVKYNDSVGKTVYVGIATLSGTTANFIQTPVASVAPATGGSKWKIDFPTPIAVNAGTKYYLILYAGPNAIDMALDAAADVYSGGAAAKDKAVLTGDWTDYSPSIDLHMTLTFVSGAGGEGVDEGCDDDGDSYCDAGLELAASGSSACPAGGGDCADTNKDINPGVAESCVTAEDDNCDGSANDPNATGCTSYYVDVDADTYGAGSPQCICTSAGTYTATNKDDCKDDDKDVKPGAVEICDNKDNNCNEQADEGCDDDNDDYCDIGMQVVGKPDTCTKGGGDCVDTNGSVYPGDHGEACDDFDDDCDGVVDNDCDKDKDGYCDADLNVSNPAPKVCLKGAGDCNDYNNDQNPGAPEVCANGIDDDCDGSQNDESATNCKDFYFDADGDTYGLSLKKCLCQAAGFYKSGKDGDCADSDKDVNPGALEVCGDGKDNNCDGGENDVGATGCKDFFLDQDSDGYGIAGAKQCICQAEGSYKGANSGDCNDTNKDISPGKAELCDNADNNCDGKVDEGCNDDADGYCDDKMTTVGFPNVCVKGGGDCNDTVAKANPGAAEACDNIDNNCQGGADEGCDDDNDDYCDAGMTVEAGATTCSKGGADCKDDDATINPGTPELCSTLADDDCDGSANDENAIGCKKFGVDADGDNYTDKTSANKCLCKAEPPLTGLNGGDCNDKNKLVNPAISELCDGVDNNCDGKTDEGCDDDQDGFCDIDMATIGKPTICLGGGGDCNDAASAINPGAKEVCNNSSDENCDKDLNGIDAVGCSKFYLDNDKDGWAVNLALCLCTAKDNYVISDVSKTGDCADVDNEIYPGAAEVCGDGKDSNCNGSQNDVAAILCKNHYKDGDKDGYGGNDGSCLCVAEGAYITTLTGDCNESDASINPGAAEACDNVDNNCAGGADEGCDDDNDDFCDSALLVKGVPTTCSKGGGDCGDTISAINPAAVETCDNLDQDCDGQADNGCDSDKDGYCEKSKTIVGTPAICLKGGNDCDDFNGLVNPGKTEICDDADNNCNSSTDEGCDEDKDGYCANSKSVNGVPKICTKGTGDCDDANAKVNPGATEICNGADDNCAGGADEICNDSDKDGYCVGSSAVSSGCPKGGGDCDDNSPAVNPGAVEDCASPIDDNCNGLSNEENATSCVTFFQDNDGDLYGSSGGKCFCSQQGTFSATRGGDCDESNAKVNPGATEVCDGLNNDCDFAFKAGAIPNSKNPITMETYSHGGGFHHFRKEYWYPQWAGGTIYRYNQAYQAQGFFNVSQSAMMDVEGDAEFDAWYSANWNHATITRRNDLNNLVWTRNIGATAGAVGHDANYVYGIRSSSNQIYLLDKGNGNVVKTYALDQWFSFNVHGGAFVHDGKLWMPNYGNLTYYRYDAATGVHDGTTFTVATNIYNGAWNGKEICISANSSQVWCYEPPAASASYTPRVIGVDPKSHGGGYSLFHDEYWYPEWSGGVVHRYGKDYKPLGTFDSGQAETRQLWGPKEEDAYYTVRHSSSTSASYVRKLKGKTNQVLWTSPYQTTYLSGVAADATTVYAMRHDSNTVYKFSVTNGSHLGNVNLSGSYDSDTMYGGLAVVDGKLYRGTVSNRNVYRYNVTTGVHDGVKFRVAPNVYGLAFDGDELCFSSTSGNPTCYKVPSSAMNFTPTVQGINPRSHGAGYHLYRKEYWYPGWSDQIIYRFDNSGKALGSFACGTTSLMQVAGDPDADTFYLAQYGGSSSDSRIKKQTGLTSSVEWNTYVTTYMAGVAVDKDFVYASRYDNGTIYRLNRGNGQLQSSFNLNTYTNTTYGIAVHNGVLWRSNSGSASIWGYNLSNGQHNNIKIQTPISILSLASPPGKLCVADSSANAPYCYDIAAHSSVAPTTNSLPYKSYGGGYHPNRKEWWYPEWSGTNIHRYDAAKNYIGNFSTASATSGTAANFPNSSLLNTTQMAQLNTWFGNSSQKWTQCYKRSTHGANSNTFHSLCDNRGPTLSVVRATTGYIFGGYATSSWGGGGYIHSSGNWLYSLTRGTRHSMCGQHSCSYGQYTSSNYGPTFGGGHDLYIASNMSSGHTNLGYTYTCNGSGGGYSSSQCQNWLGGAYNFSVDEVEVYALGGSTSIDSMRQVAGDTNSDDFFAARYDSNSSVSSSFINAYTGMPGTLKWSTGGNGQTISAYLTGVAVHNSHVYAIRYDSSQVFAINKATGMRDTSKDFTLNPYMGSYNYGGIQIIGDKLYRPASDNYLYRYNMGSGTWDGFQLAISGNPYAYASDGTSHCFGYDTSNSANSTCYVLPSDPDALGPTRIGVRTGSHGAGFHGFYKEHWYPEWSGGLIYRHDTSFKTTGSFNSGLTNVAQVVGESDSPQWYAVRYSSDSNISRVYKMGGTDSTQVWVAPYVTTLLAGVAIDSTKVYANRYDSSTIYSFDKQNGSQTGNFNLTGTFSGSAMYGGLAIVGKKLYRATTDRWVYRYDLATGVSDGVMFETAVPTYGLSSDGTSLCFNDAVTAGEVYCYAVPSGSFDLTPRVLGMDSRDRGGGFHPFHNEYWYPQWPGDVVARYSSNYAQTGTFAVGINNIAQIAGERSEDAYYVAKYSGSSDSRVYKLKGKTNNQLWSSPYITTELGGVAVDANHVYTIPYTSQTVYRLSRTDGKLTSQFNLTGIWRGGAMYGTLNVDNDRLYRASTANYTDAYRLSDGSYTGTSWPLAITPYSAAFNGEEICYGQTGNNNPIYCYGLYTGTGLLDEGCDDDKDGYCDAKMTLSGDVSKTCVKSKATCDGKLIGETCYKATNTGTTWLQAKAACEAWGGSLSSVLNEGESEEIHSLAGATCGPIGYWIGGNDLSTEGSFGWASGEQVSYKRWAANEPTSKPVSAQFAGGNLLTPSQMAQLNSWASSPNQSWKLCYKRSVHGGSSSTFHNLCDNKGATFTIIRSNQNPTFGGYTEVSWDSGSGYSNDPKAFVFSLTQNYRGQILTGGGNATYRSSYYGPTFGGGHDIHLDSNMNSGYTYFGHTYTCPHGSPGNGSCQNYLAGNYNSWGPTDVEVYIKDSVGTSNGQDYVAVGTDKLWSDVANSTTQNCYVCKRKMTTAQYGSGDDCDDADPTAGPSQAETCDNKDNNCNGVIDEGCDDDNDGYCESSMAIVGSPSTCLSGGNDCDDFNKNISPGAQESCLTSFDDNCDGATTAINAKGCVPLYSDADADGFGISNYECQCAGGGCQQAAYEQNFDKTVSGWTYETCAAGNQSTPTSCSAQLDKKGWQVSDKLLAASTPGALYYGDSLAQNFNFGASAGRAVSPKIKLPNSGELTYSGQVFLGVNADPNTDKLWINVLTNNGATRTSVWDKSKGAADFYPGSKILNSANKGTLNGWYGVPNQKWQLCYQKSRDGASSSTFHSNCDNKGPTMTVVKATNGYVFGGYSGTSWGGCCYYTGNSNNYLFSLTGNTKHAWYRYGNYQYHHSSYGSCFGGGHDFCLDSSNMQSGYSNLGHDYQCATGSYGSSSCRDQFSGSYNWTTSEVEVYYIGSGAAAVEINKWVEVRVDLTAFKGQEVQFEYYFNTVDANSNTGYGVSLDNIRVIDGTCSKFSALQAGDCDDTSPLKFPSANAENCDGVDNNCNGVIDEACDVDGDGYCTSSKPVANSPACPKTGAGVSCTTALSTSPAYDGTPMKMQQYGGHGATHHTIRKEFWHPNWSSSTEIYRWGEDLQYKGSFNSGVYYMRGLAADPLEDSYYGAEYYNYRVSKRSQNTSNTVWNSGSIGYYIGGVAVDKDWVYAMRYENPTVWRINRSNGNIQSSFVLSGAYGNDTHGGVHVFDGKLWRGGADGYVRNYDLSSGAYAGVQFQAVGSNYNSFIRGGNKWCTHYSGNDYWCYTLKNVNCTQGDDCNDQDKGISPAGAEFCDGADNDCNGKTDEGCDDDDDDYCDANLIVIGAPAICPKGGGDCNDAGVTENPATLEVCDGKDNNCDKVVDEAGAKGCAQWYYDGDQDGYGVLSNKRCLCAAGGLYTTKLGDDCNDTCANCKPGATEICDNKDNDCDNQLDEFCDSDKDGYCTTNLVVVGNPPSCPKGAGDCNDGALTIHPGVIEICNNIDENCNGKTDENAADVCTTSLPNTDADCIAGKCVIIGCDPGFLDINGVIADGCECNGNDSYEPNNTCSGASTVTADLHDGNGGRIEYFGGRIVTTDVDWYQFYARDVADEGSTACDNFRLRARFVSNPGDYYRFDIYRGACPADNNSAANWKKESHRNDQKNQENQVCCGQKDFNWFTNYKGYTKHNYSSNDSEFGQCGCTTVHNRFGTNYGYQYGPANNPAGNSGGPYGRWDAATGVYHNTSSPAWGYDFTWCHDDSDWYYMKVFKASGPAYCGDYAIELSNGVYTPDINNGKNW